MNPAGFSHRRGNEQRKLRLGLTRFISPVTAQHIRVHVKRCIDPDRLQSNQRPGLIGTLARF